jgi:hypothetical protein
MHLIVAKRLIVGNRMPDGGNEISEKSVAEALKYRNFMRGFLQAPTILMAGVGSPRPGSAEGRK